MSQSMTYNIIFTGTNMAKPVIEEVKASLNSIRGIDQTVNVAASTPNLNNQLIEAAQAADTLNPKIDHVSKNLYVITVANQKTGESFQQLATTGTNGLQMVGNQAVETSEKMSLLGTKSMSAFNAIRTGASMSLFMGSMLISRQLQEVNSQEAITQATERYTLAVREKGAGSTEARKALEQLDKTQRNYQAATQLSTIMTASLGIQLVGLGASIIRYIPTVNTLTGSLQSLASVQAVVSAFSGPYGWAKLAVAGGVIAGIGAGAYALANNAQQPQNNVNVNVNVDQDIISQYLQRTGTTKAQTIGG